MNSDDYDAALARALAALTSLAVMYLAAHPDAIDKALYRARLYLAYHPNRPNSARLRHLRALRWAGAFDDDLHAEKEADK